MSQRTALVIGAGAFGTAIASVLANNFDKVILKVRSEDVYTPIKENDENAVYLPGLKLPSHLVPALSWDEVDELKEGNIELIVSGLPTAAISGFYEENLDRFQKYLDQEIPVVSLSKGIDPVTLEMADDLFYESFPHHKELFTFLSGPSFAKEIVQAQITLVTLAGRSRKILTKVSQMFESPYFKALPSYDVKGVLLGGALKNVLAIAGGVIEGLGYNDNTRAAMITRGIAEMLRFGRVFNARPETFYGLSGMGDLILTTTGGLSRNKQFGLELAKGRTPAEIISSQRTTVEGYKTTQAVHLLSEKYEIRANIFNAAYEVMFNEKEAKEVIETLMNTPSRFELE
ncbi:MAG: glycerol-3-phosphate dehydrogenase (NAD(P)+) [Bacteriovoracaceae bacterium]|jgi:glycerol-3-phosphate dehydrogenase (NAD(P)+)